jgi:hypothetical protein
MLISEELEYLKTYVNDNKRKSRGLSDKNTGSDKQRKTDSQKVDPPPFRM